MNPKVTQELLVLFREGQESLKKAADLIEKTEILEQVNKPHRTPFELLLLDIGLPKESLNPELLKKIEERFSVKLKIQIEHGT